jgi:hypothetical protein
MDTFSFPIVFDNTGLKKLTENSNEYYRHILSMAVRTEPNVMPITPDFGLFDPTFRTIDPSTFIQQAARFVPEVVIDDVDIDVDNDSAVNVTFTFSER